MIGRSQDSCRAVSGHLSAYTDGALNPVEHQRVQAHLDQCQECTTRLGQQQELCGLLAGASRTEASTALTDRLTSIAGGSSDAPLWLSQHCSGRLPSPRAARRKAAAVSSGTLLIACMVLLAVGLAMAPNLPVIADADSRASREYDVSTGFGAIASAITAVLAVPADEFQASTQVSSPHVLSSTTPQPISAEQGLAMLSGTGDPSQSYAGTQRVVLGSGTDFITATVDVAQQPAGPVALRVRGRDGAVVTSGLVMQPTTTDPVLPAGSTGFRLGAGGQICGQPVSLLEAHRADGSLVARWWISPTLHLVLWAESFDPDGHVVRSAGFTSLDVGADAAMGESWSALQLSAAPAKVTTLAGPVCGNGFSCAAHLGDLQLIELSTDSPTHPRVVHAIYGQGALRVSVVQQRGQLAQGQQPSYGVAAERVVHTWQSGSVVYTLTTNANPELASALVAQLPHLSPIGTGTWDRCRSGLSQLFG